MQCPCGGETNFVERKLKKPETVAAWAQKPVECEYGYLQQFVCRECLRIMRRVYDQNWKLLAQFG